MIIKEIMTRTPVTVEPGDTLSHAANLLRQHQFHHLPVVRHVKIGETPGKTFGKQNTVPVLQGLVTSSDIDVAAAQIGESSSQLLQRPWQDRLVAEIMHQASVRITPNTDVASAAQLLVERGFNCIPVVEYEAIGQQNANIEVESRPVLVGLLTRSDLLIALARMLGHFEPGMQLIIPFPGNNLAPLVQTLHLATELHIQVRSVIAAPKEGGIPHSATIRLATINPSPLLIRLKEANINYAFASPLMEGDKNA